jgi:peptide/nickel transport system ATP-binding protein
VTVLRSAEPLLEVEDLHVTFNRRGSTPVHAVDGVSFTISAGDTVGIVGESGSGKSVTSLAVLGLLPDRGADVSGSVRFQGRQLLGLEAKEMQELRGRDIAMVFQDPMSSLNPVLTVGRQISEVLQRHQGLNGRAASARAAQLLDEVGIPDPNRRINEYPHQLSGGMRQRAMIAMAVACNPKLLIADEPTTALDVTIQAQILELLKALVRQSDAALILITHDLGVVAGLCEQVHVMYSGRVVESADRRELFAHPQHPYTNGLLASVPRLDQPKGLRLEPIAGSPRDTIAWSKGCAFAPRCPRVVGACLGDAPPLSEVGIGHGVRCVNPVPVAVLQ